MANPSPTIILTIILATMFMSVHTRPLTNTTTITPLPLAARLKLDNAGGDGQVVVGGSGSPGYWDSLLQLHACTGEIILFFLNGETYLGTGCCRAIEVIEKNCWPSMMGSLGFTAEEGDILLGYCDLADDGDVPIAAPPPRIDSNITSDSSTDGV